MNEYHICVCGVSRERREFLTAVIKIKAESTRLAILRAAAIEESSIVWKGASTELDGPVADAEICSYEIDYVQVGQ